LCRMFVMIGGSDAVDRARDSMITSLVNAAKKDPHGQALFGNAEISHRDGWGWVALHLDSKGAALHFGRSTTSIYEDPSINAPRLVYLPSSGKAVLMIHARAASKGMPINIFSTHPVEATTSNGYRLFLIHNGTVDKEELLRILNINAESNEAKIYNDTYFLAQYMAKKISKGIDLSIIHEAVRLTKTALNIGVVLIKEQEAWVAVGSFYKARDDEVRRKYYKIYRGEIEDLVIYSSSTLIDFYNPNIDMEWKELENGRFEIYRISGEKIDIVESVIIKI